MREIQKNNGLPARQGLYDPAQEHDACGVGFVVNMRGEKSHAIVRSGLEILVNLTHRGACGCDPLDRGGGVMYYLWRAEVGPGERLTDLETENARLGKAASDLTLDKPILQEAAWGNY